MLYEIVSCNNAAIPTFHAIYPYILQNLLIYSKEIIQIMPNIQRISFIVAELLHLIIRIIPHYCKNSTDPKTMKKLPPYKIHLPSIFSLVPSFSHKCSEYNKQYLQVYSRAC